jgi:hypothetical protein
MKVLPNAFGIAAMFTRDGIRELTGIISENIMMSQILKLSHAIYHESITPLEQH